MGYALLTLGVALWAGAHFWKRAAPESRAAMGDAGKGLVAALLVASILLMIVGYRWAPTDTLWLLGRWVYPVNNVLVLVAFYLFASSGAKTRITRHVRHPQLTAMIVWASAHLLVNGDAKAVLLFGGLLVWAGAEIAVLNRAAPAWTPAHAVPARKEVTAVIATIVLYLVVYLVHGWIGPSPSGV